MKRPFPECSVQQALGAIGGKWRALTLYCLSAGPQRFGQLRRTMPQISERMLTLTLHELERDGLIERTVRSQLPMHVEYALTELGDTLTPLVQTLREWGVTYGAEFSARKAS